MDSQQEPTSDSARPVIATLDYAHPDRVIPHDSLHRIARFCGRAPLIVGLGVYLIFLLTRWKVLALAGSFTLAAGALLFVVGVICLGWYRYQIAHAEPADAAGPRRNFQVDLIVLLLNLPIAAFCAWSGITLMEGDSPVSVTVVNHAAGAIDQVTLQTATGREIKVVKLQPGQARAVSGAISNRDVQHLHYHIQQAAGRIRDGSIAPASDGFPCTSGFVELQIIVSDSTVTCQASGF